MTMPTNAAADGVPELVRQRDQLRAWIAKLDEVQTGAPNRVTQRVRADYEDRLRRVTEDLSAHGEEIRRGLEGLREQLSAAEERRAHAADALEETRLRHLIGELDEGAWEQAREPLEAEAAAADQAVAQAQGEFERLSTLSAEISGAAAEPEPEEEQDEPAEPLPYIDDEAASAEPAALATSADEAESQPQASQDEAEPESEWGAAPRAEQPEAEDEDADGGLSGEDLAAWITEVEAEVTSADAAPPREDETAEGWDPFANEFGGAPASPSTQPGDATRQLPWLGALEGSDAGGRWEPPADADDELAFLENLDAPAPAASDGPPADLADDDLAFLEELDRAISGGGQRPAPPAAPAQADAPGLGLIGGSGEGPREPADGTEEAPKRGEALLCKECGAINEPQAWYCEICGSEL